MTASQYHHILQQLLRQHKQLQRMFSGFFKWIASFQVKTNYQAVLLAASYPDQYPPDQDSIQVILQAFSGKSQEVRPQVAVIEFFKLLDKGQYRSSWTFNLKMLVIIDRCLEQRLIIDDVLSYDSRYLSEFHNFGLAHNSTLRNKLISQYYSYIKSKAYLFSQPKSIFAIKPRDRLAYVSRLNVDSVSKLIRTTNQLQVEILAINTNYKNGDKKSQLIEYLFCNLLNTVLSCYTIQSICISVLITKIPSLELQQLVSVKAMIEQMNRTTKDTIRFIESNKDLQGFKDLKYGNFFSFDARIVSIVDEAILNFDDGRKSMIKDVDTEDWQQTNYNLEVSRGTLQRRGFKNNSHFLPGIHRKYIRDDTEGVERAVNYFKQFKNNFNDDISAPMLLRESVGQMWGNTRLKQSGSMKGRTVVYSKPAKFDEEVWNRYENVYAN